MLLMDAIRGELKRRVKNDPNMYVVRRIPRNETEVVRYQSSRTGAAGGFEATELESYNLVTYTSRRWADFVAANKTKMQTGRAKYDVIVLPKEMYYTLPCYQKVQVVELQELRKNPDTRIMRRAEEFLGEIDCFNTGYGNNPRFRIKDWLERLER